MNVFSMSYLVCYLLCVIWFELDLLVHLYSCTSTTVPTTKFSTLRILSAVVREDAQAGGYCTTGLPFILFLGDVAVIGQTVE